MYNMYKYMLHTVYIKYKLSINDIHITMIYIIQKVPVFLC